MEIVPITTTLSFFFVLTAAFWIAIIYGVVLLFRHLKQLVTTQAEISGQLTQVISLLEEGRRES